MDIVDPRIDAYLRTLQTRHDEPVLLEMEEEGARRNFPIVGRNVGATLELLARAIGARRVFELGSGFGYSAYWFAKAVGSDGEVHCTDGDPANESAAAGYLKRAGLVGQIRYHVGDAVTWLNDTPGEFDVIYDDIDKQGYPDAWRAARERLRVGGLYICDNVLWSGRVAPDGEPPDDVTPAILEHNAMIAADERYASSILPIRDGVMVALRLS
jgi:predicted O-methyltransferase YrrM